MQKEIIEALALPSVWFTFPRMSAVVSVVFLSLTITLRASSPTNTEFKKWETLSHQLEKTAHHSRDLKKTLMLVYGTITPVQMEAALQHSRDVSHPDFVLVLKLIPDAQKEEFISLAQTYRETYLEAMKVGDSLGTDTVDASHLAKIDPEMIEKFAEKHYVFQVALREARMILFPLEDPGMPPAPPARKSFDGEPGILPGNMPSTVMPNHFLRSA